MHLKRGNIILCVGLNLCPFYCTSYQRLQVDFEHFQLVRLDIDTVVFTLARGFRCGELKPIHHNQAMKRGKRVFTAVYRYRWTLNPELPK